jgi:hypothetical protein
MPRLKSLPILFPGTKSAFCAVDCFVAEGAKRRMKAGGPRSEGHITDDPAPNAAWTLLGEQFRGTLNFRSDRRPGAIRDSLVRHQLGRHSTSGSLEPASATFWANCDPISVVLMNVSMSSALGAHPVRGKGRAHPLK